MLARNYDCVKFLLQRIFIMLFLLFIIRLGEHKKYPPLEKPRKDIFKKSHFAVLCQQKFIWST